MMLDRPAIIRQQEVWLRCACPVCLRLDKRFPAEGYQLAFWAYVPAVRRAGAR